MTPDQEWLNDPEREFPITIDPTYASGSAKASFDTYVSKSSPNTSFASATELKVGTHNGGGEVARSFIWFPLSAIRLRLPRRPINKFDLDGKRARKKFLGPLIRWGVTACKRYCGKVSRPAWRATKNFAKRAASKVRA